MKNTFAGFSNSGSPNGSKKAPKRPIKSLNMIVSGALLLIAIIALGYGFLGWRSHHNGSGVDAKDHYTIPANESALESNPLVRRACEPLLPSEVIAECYYFYTHVPNNDEASRKGFRLPVVLLRTPKPSDASAPTNLIVRIPGGPGVGFQTRTEEILYWQGWLQEKQASFDLLLYDPRGTGDSLPSPRCEEYDRQSDVLLAEPVSVQDESALLNPILQTCLEDFAALLSRFVPSSESSLSVFASQQQAEDIDRITRALSYSEVALWGVSYGTRVALLAARYPQIKFLLLDSPYPFEEGKHADWPALYEYDFALHERLYAEFIALNPNAKNSEVYASYSKLYLAVSRSLKEKAITLNLENWSSGERVAFALTADRLVDINLDVLYDVSSISQYYRGLQHFAATGKVGSDLREVLDGFISNVLDEQFNYFVYFMVECLDNPLGTKQEYDAALAHARFTKEYFDGLWKSNICRSPLFSSRNLVAEEPYHLKPTLIYSGQFDPVTPAEWGHDLYATLRDEFAMDSRGTVGEAFVANGSQGGPGIVDVRSEEIKKPPVRWIQVPGAGHAVVDMELCGGELVSLLSGDLARIPAGAQNCSGSLKN